MVDNADAYLAHRLAAEAGSVLVGVRASLRHRSQVAVSALGDAGDRASHRFLQTRLAVARPGDAVLSEEAVDDPARLAADRVWIIDPLDGTREFGEGRADWAVHVALWRENDLAAGAVALPGRGTTLSTDTVRRRPRHNGLSLRIAVSRSRAPALAEHVARRLGAELVPMGSAGYKTAAVVLGEVDAYVHAGGQYEWDSAAPVAVARAAGLHTSRIDGSVLWYNQADPYLPDLLVCRPEQADLLLSACAAFVPEAEPGVAPAQVPAP
jgi:3'(2'), 5'-bisphosphate nucleotidase